MKQSEKDRLHIWSVKAELRGCPDREMQAFREMLRGMPVDRSLSHDHQRPEPEKPGLRHNIRPCRA